MNVMAYLDHLLKAKNERLRQAHKGNLKPIIKGDRRTHVINKILDELADYRQSPFEHEGDCRAGLRSALCLGGHSWSASDLEAANLVAESLLLIGAKRPTWDEGQPEYLLSYDVCQGCNGPLPTSEYEGNRKGMFCSSVCASGWIERRQATFVGFDWLRRAAQSGASSSKVYVAAQNILHREARPLRKCVNCKREYRPFGRNGRDQNYCSHACYSEAKQTIPTRECPQCRTQFRGFSETQIFCSRACQKQQSFQKCCPGCRSVFTAKSKKAIYCSDACRARIKKNPDASVLPGMVRKYSCLHCMQEFEATSAKKKYCGSRCSGAAERLRLRLRKAAPSNVIYLTVEIFDSWFKRAA